MTANETTINNIRALKCWLRELDAAGRRSYGFFAEYLYAATTSATRKVETVHSGGVDFILDGKTKVDVKSRLRLNCDAYATFLCEPKGKRLPGVFYPHVVFYDDAAVIYDEEPTVDRRWVSWERIAAVFADYKNAKKRCLYFPKNPSQVAANKQVLEVLIAWIQTEWKLSAKKVRRSSPIAMEGMNNSEWGPEAFYHDPSRNTQGYDLVVLVYFNGETDCEVCAYPLRMSDRIAWDRKKFGNKRMTFDPNKLDPRFRFDSIDHFKKEFRRRFPGPGR